jgi:hypothetical protein
LTKVASRKAKANPKPKVETGGTLGAMHYVELVVDVEKGEAIISKGKESRKVRARAKQKMAARTVIEKESKSILNNVVLP